MHSATETTTTSAGLAGFTPAAGVAPSGTFTPEKAAEARGPGDRRPSDVRPVPGRAREDETNSGPRVVLSEAETRFSRSANTLSIFLRGKNEGGGIDSVICRLVRNCAVELAALGNDSQHPNVHGARQRFLSEVDNFLSRLGDRSLRDLHEKCVKKHAAAEVTDRIAQEISRRREEIARQRGLRAEFLAKANELAAVFERHAGSVSGPSDVESANAIRHAMQAWQAYQATNPDVDADQEVREALKKAVEDVVLLSRFHGQNAAPEGSDSEEETK
ncbi:MAG TPA: hypothetical protein VHA82_05715 [Ramlibacter sp.]|uniref:hypothetical protein n=1 Tax=Ramlibacter sp. TaxID=1917967 RepID=UPI002CA2423F|nr:hypothetical protein [Ramlibacter sp.]HVZ43288.1 hypothetical protein [Ramlibacter sp.]